MELWQKNVLESRYRASGLIQCLRQFGTVWHFHYKFSVHTHCKKWKTSKSLNNYINNVAFTTPVWCKLTGSGKKVISYWIPRKVKLYRYMKKFCVIILDFFSFQFHLKLHVSLNAIIYYLSYGHLADGSTQSLVVNLYTNRVSRHDNTYTSLRYRDSILHQ